MLVAPQKHIDLSKCERKWLNKAFCLAVFLFFSFQAAMLQVSFMYIYTFSSIFFPTSTPLDFCTHRIHAATIGLKGIKDSMDILFCAPAEQCFLLASNCRSQAGRVAAWYLGGGSSS